MAKTEMIFLAIIIIAVTVLVLVCFRIVSKRQADKKRQALKSSFEVLKDTIADALDDISKKFIYSHYITESERVEIENKYAGLYQKISKIFGSKYFKEIDGTEQLVRLHTALSDTKGFKETNNARFIEAIVR